VLLSPVRRGESPRLVDADAVHRGELPRGEEALEDATRALCARAIDLQEALYAESRQALLVVLQARDAGGKDGTIRKVFGEMNPVGLRVTAFKTPTADELAHDFLWRAHRDVPPHGCVGVFNRSHYEDVLVARVRGLVPKKVWSARYRQIDDFERMLTENGVTLLKLFLHVSRKEQKERLVKRLDDPRKNWKVAEDDWDDRQHWSAFTRAYRDALAAGCRAGPRGSRRTAAATYLTPRPPPPRARSPRPSPPAAPCHLTPPPSPRPARATAPRAPRRDRSRCPSWCSR
jgi:PPK2 family polyphosphate:nucleotide phosphotransferase